MTKPPIKIGDWISFMHGDNLFIGEVRYISTDGSETFYYTYMGLACENSVLEVRHAE